MTTWVRLWEKLTGRPHRLDDSNRVRMAAEKLRESASKIDPLVAIALNFNFTPEDGEDDR
jgi:hypothetical protein